VNIVPTTKMPTTMSPVELAVYSVSIFFYKFIYIIFKYLKKCNCTWEPFQQAVIKFNDGEGLDPYIVGFAARAGYIENSTEKEFVKFVKVT
jgi:hypothetical protein